MLAGRASVYDNEYYVTATYPPALASSLVQLTHCQRASMAIMHVFVQCPRLNCLVRHAVMHPDNTEALAAAVTMTEYMWQIDLPAHVAELVRTAVTMADATSSWDMADILTETLHYDSVQSMILCTRYWMLQNVVCGLTDTLQRYFPAETSLSQLPPPLIVRKFDVDAGIRLAESLPWAESVSQRLPLVPLRLHTPLQISIGPWHRTTRNMTLWRSDTVIDIATNEQASFELDRASRMKTWLVDECNRIHDQWDVSTVDEKSLYEALDSMAGEQIPDWLPTRVRFEAEDGEMLMKLDYERPDGDYQRTHNLDGSNSTTYSPRGVVDNSLSTSGSQEIQDHAENAEIGTSTASTEGTESFRDTRSTPLRPADFIFGSGRNLCSTSGWWPTSESSIAACTPSSLLPTSPRPSVVLLDSTHKASAFQPKTRRRTRKNDVAFDNRHINGCMSPAWSTSQTSSASDYRGATKSTSPA